MALPVAKLVSVLLKQISKPVAARIKAAATTRESLHVALARFGKTAMALEFRLNALLTPGKDTRRMSLPTKSQSVERGADVLGEILVFTVAAGTTIAEYTWSKSKSQAKEAKIELQELERRMQVERDLRELRNSVDAQSRTIEVLQQRLIDMETPASTTNRSWFGLWSSQ